MEHWGDEKGKAFFQKLGAQNASTRSGHSQMAQLIIAAVIVEGRAKSEVARDYGVSRYWVQQLVQRYQRDGPIAFTIPGPCPRARR